MHKLEIKGLLTALQSPSEVRSELRHEYIHKQVGVYMLKNNINLVFQSEAHYKAYSETGAVLMGNFSSNFNTANTEKWSQTFKNGRVNYLQKNNILPYINPKGNQQWNWKDIGTAINYWKTRESSTKPFFILLGAEQVKR